MYRREIPHVDLRIGIRDQGQISERIPCRDRGKDQVASSIFGHDKLDESLAQEPGQ